VHRERKRLVNKGILRYSYCMFSNSACFYEHCVRIHFDNLCCAIYELLVLMFLGVYGAKARFFDRF
jgi:hypothetical protein